MYRGPGGAYGRIHLPKEAQRESPEIAALDPALDYEARITLTEKRLT